MSASIWKLTFQLRSISLITWFMCASSNSSVGFLTGGVGGVGLGIVVFLVVIGLGVGFWVISGGSEGVMVGD